MSDKLLSNVSIFHPIDSINNLVYGGIIKAKQGVDKIYNTTDKVTSTGDYDKLT